MKTILTLFAFISISSVALAGERHPTITVTSTGEFKMVIDGKQFNNERKVYLNDLQKGTHYIDVWKKKKGLFGSKYKLVSSKQFELANKDLDIDVNFSGYITIGKQGKGWDGDKWYNKDKNKKNYSKNK
jgi:hypothetical protein